MSCVGCCGAGQGSRENMRGLPLPARPHRPQSGRIPEEVRMAEPTVWWLLAGAAVAVELATGTFYLLMLALGMAAAAIAAHLGASIPLQLVTAAVVGGGAVG